MILPYMVAMGYWKTIHIDATYNLCFSSSPNLFYFIFSLPFPGNMNGRVAPHASRYTSISMLIPKISMDVIVVREEANASLNPRYTAPVQTSRFRTEKVLQPTATRRTSGNK
jgi:hypothetical protein